MNSNWLLETVSASHVYFAGFCCLMFGTAVSLCVQTLGGSFLFSVLSWILFCTFQTMLREDVLGLYTSLFGSEVDQFSVEKSGSKYKIVKLLFNITMALPALAAIIPVMSACMASGIF
jgi:hypothetical protein